MINLTVDGKVIEAEQGKTLLQVCLENDIYIPNLCYLEEMANPPASCRLCFVEIEGEPKPVTSCKIRVQEGMVVRTDTEPVRQLQRVVFNLLFSAHHMDCKNCNSRKACQLQRIAKFLGIRLKARKLEELGRDLTVQPEHPFFELQPARCILCHKCLYVCRERNETPVLTIVRRGFDSAIGCYEGSDPGKLPCGECGACVEICPVSAIVPKKEAVKDAVAGS